MAANIFTGATSANWNTATNWSLGAVPTAADGNIATFDATSPNCTVNVADAPNHGIDFTGYTNVLTMTNNTLTTAGTVTFQANQALRIAGAGTLRFSGNCTLISNGGTWPNSLETNNGTYTLTGAAIVTGNYNALGPSNNVVNGSMSIGGNLNIAAGVHSGTGTYTMTGTGTWSGATGTLTKNLTFNSAGTITLSGTINYHTGTITYTNIGTLVKTGSVLNINAGATPPTLNTNGMIWASITTQMTANAITLSSDMAFSGTWTVANTTTVNGAFSINCTGSLAVGGFIFNGTATFKFKGTGTWSGNGNFRMNCQIDTGANVLTVSGTVGYNTGTLLWVSGTPTVTGSTLSITTTTTLNTNGMSWNNVTINGAGTITLSSALDVNGTLTLGSAANTTTINGAFNITVAGSVSIAATTGAITGTASIVMDGTGTLSRSSSGILQMNLTVNTAGTITFSGLIEYNTGTLTWTAGSITFSSFSLQVSAATSTNVVLNQSGFTMITLTLSGSANGTLYFSGSSGWTCTNLVGVSASGTNPVLKMKSGNTYTVTGSIGITHSGSDTLNFFTIRSDTAGVQAIFTLDGAATQDIDHCGAIDVDSSGGQTINSFHASGTTPGLSNATNWRDTPTGNITISSAFRG